ncbi:methylated-DNA--[protein]-cysteine S-methyltransferase [Luteimonas sp. RIT-PG2_3]
MITWTTFDSPVGPLMLATTDAGLHALEFGESRHPVRRDARWQQGDHPLLQRARAQLDAYFAGTLRDFDLPLAPQGTAFQCEVWKALTTIPYGRTLGYGELAARIGKPSAVRAVGAANGRNPLSIFVPCHRVIGADGTLTGYGGGLPTKEFLLSLEGAWPRTDLFSAERR